MARPITLLAPVFTILAVLPRPGAEAQLSPDEVLLFTDRFDRTEDDDAVEQVGNGWSTNSASRAKGHKQVDLDDGVMRVVCHPEANHAVSVRHDITFADGVVRMRFMLPGDRDSLGVNLADLEFKGVHAGHLCMARVSLTGVQIDDLKAGKMERGVYKRRKAGAATETDKKLLKTRTRRFPLELTAGRWYTLEMIVRGASMGVAIDGEPVGVFASPGIAHPTKRLLRLSIPHEAVVDDVSVSSIAGR